MSVPAEKERKFTTAEAARLLRRSYNSIKYAVGNGDLEFEEKTRDGTFIFSETELRRFASVKGISIDD